MLEKIRKRLQNVPFKFDWYKGSIDKKTLLVMILMAFAFSIAIRVVSVYPQWSNNVFVYNKAPIIKSPDGFYYAEGARDILAGDKAPTDGRSPTGFLIAKLTAVCYYLTPGVSFEWLIFLMPVVFASLIVVPIVLLGVEAGSALLGFFASLLAASSIGFYQRSFAGYYDDDFLTLVLPFFVVYGLIRFARTKSFGSAILIVLSLLIYSEWYGNGKAISAAMLTFFALYTLKYERKSIENYAVIGLGFLAVSGLPFWPRMAILLPALFLYKRGFKYISQAVLFCLVGFGTFLAYGGFDPLFARFNYYIFKPVSQSDALNLHFYSTLKTVAESQYSDFTTIVSSFSGNIYFFISGIIGFLLLGRSDKRFWLLLPLLSMGFLAIDGGARFTPYGSPILALGLIYLAVLVAGMLPKEIVRHTLVAAVAFGAMYPSYKMIRTIQTPSALTTYEAEQLVALSKIAKPNDYIYSWWDYGYQTRYYTKAKTHSDGSAQEGGLVYIESMALTMPGQAFAANWLRDATEVHELGLQNKIKPTGSTLGDMMTYSKNPTKNPWELVSAMSSPDYETMQKSRDVYWMMPFRMLQIFGTIQAFADIDPKTGKGRSGRFYLYSNSFNETQGSIKFAEGGVEVDKALGVVKTASNQEPIPLSKFVKVTKNGDGSTLVDSTEFYGDNAPLVLVYIAQAKVMLLMDKLTFNSNFIQMYALGVYDPKLFEFVADNGWMKVFKLKK